MSNLGMDIAASEFFKNGKYDLDFKNPETEESDWIDSDALLEMYKVILNYQLCASWIMYVFQGFIKDYPVVSIEDPFDQDDWAGYAKLTSETQIQVLKFCLFDHFHYCD